MTRLHRALVGAVTSLLVVAASSSSSYPWAPVTNRPLHEKQQLFSQLITAMEQSGSIVASHMIQLRESPFGGHGVFASQAAIEGQPIILDSVELEAAGILLPRNVELHPSERERRVRVVEAIHATAERVVRVGAQQYELLRDTKVQSMTEVALALSLDMGDRRSHWQAYYRLLPSVGDVKHAPHRLPCEVWDMVASLTAGYVGCRSQAYAGLVELAVTELSTDPLLESEVRTFHGRQLSRVELVELVFYCVSLVQSRAYSIDGVHIYLKPLNDLFNHHSSAKVQSSDFLFGRDTGPGREVFINYVPSSTLINLYLAYDFVPVDPRDRMAQFTIAARTFLSQQDLRTSPCRPLIVIQVTGTGQMTVPEATPEALQCLKAMCCSLSYHRSHNSDVHLTVIGSRVSMTDKHARAVPLSALPPSLLHGQQACDCLKPWRDLIPSGEWESDPNHILHTQSASLLTVVREYRDVFYPKLAEAASATQLAFQ